jgi:gamma-glutamylcyclotransferase (GGCT)/AIG2-like uncharacterized protein YtfP
MPELLFIYGTLHPDRAPAEIAPIARSLTPVGPATVRGTLLDLGAYPGIRLSSAGTEVQGHLFALPVPSAATWAALDRYEDFRPHDPAASLFVRRQTTALRPSGQEVVCCIYEYNLGRTQDATLLQGSLSELAGSSERTR